MAEDDFDRLGKGRGRVVRGGIGDASAIARNQNGSQSRGASCGNIARRIAEQPRTLEFKLHVLRSLQKHARARFAPRVLAGVLGRDALGMERAIVEAFDGALQSSLLVDEFGDLRMHRVDIGLGEATAGNAALIGRDDKTKSRIAQAAQRGRHSFDESGSRWNSSVGVVGHQGAVSIKKNRRIHRRSECLTSRPLRARILTQLMIAAPRCLRINPEGQPRALRPSITPEHYARASRRSTYQRVRPQPRRLNIPRSKSALLRWIPRRRRSWCRSRVPLR